MTGVGTPVMAVKREGGWRVLLLNCRFGDKSIPRVWGKTEAKPRLWKELQFSVKN